MEAIASSLANFLGGLMVLMFGLILRFVKDSAGMLAGFNSMSAKEMSKWNMKTVRRYLGNALIISSCVLIVAGILAFADFFRYVTLYISWGVFLIMLIVSVVNVNRSDRFKV